MSIDRKIISEIERYRSINKYIMEQDAAAIPPPPPGGEDLGALAPPPGGIADAPAPAAPVPPAEPEPKGGGTEELDITDLVDSQKNIESKQDEYFNNLFSQIQNLESKLKEMDGIVNKLNSLEMKIEKYREKTPEEKLELRTYDSYPFNQKLSDFFDDKKLEMEKTGKNDYVLTTDEVEDVNINDIKKSFSPGKFNSEY
jgi:hypothetical protein